MPTRCNRGFYCRSYCLLNMFRASLCPSSGAQEYYIVVAACGIFCCGFSSSWSGVELRVMRPVCRMLVYWLCFSLRCIAPQGSPRTPTARIAATTPRLIVRILNSVFLKTFKNFELLSNFNEVQTYSLMMIC